MSENRNLTPAQELHVESHAPYLKVFFGLLVFTILEYCYASTGMIAFLPLLVGLMVMAIIKAAMVGWYFMHLKFEGRWVYYMLIPAGILAVILTVALMPDVAMQPETEENSEPEEIVAALIVPDAPLMIPQPKHGK